MALKVNTFSDLPDDAFIRQSDIVRDPKHPDRPVLLSISASTYWRWIKAGLFPPGVKLGPNSTFWRVGDVRAWMERQRAQAAVAVAA
jgi:prophage regulatory protein